MEKIERQSAFSMSFIRRSSDSRKKELDIRALSTNKDFLFYVNDNLKHLDCKEIINTKKDASSKIETLATSISSRIQLNNSNIAKYLSEAEVAR